MNPYPVATYAWRPNSIARRVAATTAALTASTKPRRPSSVRPASVVPPGDVTISRRRCGVSLVSWSIAAAPRIVCSASSVATSRVRPAATPPAISASAVRDKSGHVHVALANLDPKRPATVSIALTGVTATRAQGRMITAAAMDAHNSFQAPDAVHPVAFTGAQVSGGRISATLPAKSLVVLALD